MKKNRQKPKLPDIYFLDGLDERYKNRNDANQLTFNLPEEHQRGGTSWVTPKAVQEIREITYRLAREYGAALTEEEEREADKLLGTTFSRKLLGFFELFQFILPRKPRRELCEPAYNDLKADYLLARRYRSKIARIWLTFCFAFRTVAMVVDCFWLIAGKKMRAFLWLLMPEAIHRLWKLWNL
jgi:hypothetical protein